MSRIRDFRRRLLVSALGSGLVACSLDSDLPGRSGNVAPVSSGVTLSGAGAPEADAAAEYGEGTRISNISGSNNGGNGSSSNGGSNGSSSGSSSGGNGSSSGGNGSPRASAGMPAASNNVLDESAAGLAGASSSGAGAAASEAPDPGASGGAAGSVAKDPPELWFSEYVEGSSSNKALEIVAPKHVVLDGCKVSTHFNGKIEGTVVATLSGVLEAGQVLTLCTSSLQEKLGDTCNQVGNLTFNGDDGVRLSCNGTILDVIGQIGVDPGVAWGDDTNSTVDHTLRRKCSVRMGDAQGSDPFDPNPEWQAFPVDSFDGLGARGCY